MRKHYTLSGLLLCLMTLLTLGASAAPDKDYLCFTANQAGSTVELTKNITPTAVTIEYSTDEGSSWTSVDFSTETTTSPIALASVGDKVYFRNASALEEVTAFSTSSSNYYQFAMTGSIAASGNVMSLVDWNCATTTIPCTNCFNFLFKDCTALTTAPVLPAATLKNYCYQGMFQGCTSLAAAPELSATTLADRCYQGMFKGCTSLATAPVLPATSLAVACYASMFSGCTALLTAPKLFATTLKNYCYQEMFQGCASLTTAPALSATTLAMACYIGMFQGCTSLTTGPALPATTLVPGCYYQMFSGCSALNSVKVGFTDWGTNCTTNWLDGVASTGTFTCPEGLDVTTTGASNIPTGWTVQHPQVPDYLCFTANTAPSTVTLKKVGTPAEVTIQYSTDGTSWSNLEFETAITLANEGDKVYMCNASGDVTDFSISDKDHYQFVMTGSIAASGNVMSLVNQTCQTTTVPCNYCFCKLFSGCTSLTTAPELPATTLAQGCYGNLFKGCSSLTTVPALPATALTEKCYYGMFSGCTSLKSAPELPATTLANECYNSMFSGCSQLTTAPELPAATLVEKCYYEMFKGCTTINDVKVGLTAFDPAAATFSWVAGVDVNSKFTCPTVLSTAIEALSARGRNTSTVPSGWTVKNTYDLTITSESGWASLCVNLPLKVPEGVEVYYASAVDGTTITLTQIAAGTVMAPRTAIIVKGTKGVAVSFPVASEAGTSYTNLFQGSSVAKACNASENYVLNASMSSDTNVHFSIYTGTTLTDHKAYLPMSAVGGASSIQFRFGDATAVGSVETEAAEDVIYNLAGQRVGSDYRGFVIKNGKKAWNN